MKIKNKLAAICLVSAFAFALSSCKGKNEAEDAKQGSEPETQDAAMTEIDTNTSSRFDNVERVADREDYVGVQDLSIDEYVMLNDYKNMKVKAYKPVADDKAIEEYINSNFLKGYISDRAVENGDVVNIDYEGKEEGVAFEGGTAQGTDLEIGSGSFIAGFEEGLIGVMPGETVTLNLAFPKDYHSAEHAGKAVVFSVKVNGIAYSAEYADLTKEDMARLGLSQGSKEELWAAAKKELEKSAQETFEADKTSAILNQILEESTIKSVPEYLVEEQIQSNEIYMDSMCRMYYNTGLESYLQSSQGITLAEFEADIRPDCEKTVKQYLVLEAVAKAENIEITDDIIRDYAQKDIEGYEGYTVDKYIEEVGYTTYRMFVLQEKVIERLSGMIDVEPVSEQ